MKIFRIGKRLGGIILTLALVLTMGASVMPSYAAGSGTATVTYKPVAEGKLDATTFSLYKVGHFERYKEGDVLPKGYEVGDAYLALDDGIPNAGGKVDVTIRKDAYTDEKAWTAAWQTSAAALASVIDGAGVKPIATAQAVAPTGIATFTGLEDGLYLVTGTPNQKYMDPATQTTTYYTPNASFILVFQGQASLVVKYETKTVKEYVLHKAWSIPAKYRALQPESIQVRLLSKTQESEVWKEEEIVTLNDENNWTYEWESDPDLAWKWEEIMSEEDSLNFVMTEETPVFDENDNKQYITLTNAYTRYQLELTKILDQFLENGDNSATFAFEIRGFIGTKQVYTGSAGINFAKDATGSMTKLVDNIPANLTRLEVEEVYTGNYKAVGAKVKDATFNVDRGLYTVSFENEFNDDVTIKGGIVNKYTNEEGKIVLKDKDYGKTPSAQEQ